MSLKSKQVAVRRVNVYRTELTLVCLKCVMLDSTSRETTKHSHVGTHQSQVCHKQPDVEAGEFTRKFMR